jgi:two-component system chemotaxis sensor kinase CheA
MSTPEETFLLEVSELLTAMEDALLRMEDAPDDPDSINAIFRAAHTIKGTGGVFGYDTVVSFTHVLENVLDKVRDNEVEVDAALIAILLLSRDHIEILVNKAVAEEALDAEEIETDTKLLVDLNQYLGVEVNIKNTNENEKVNHDLIEPVATIEVENKGQLVDSDNWHLSLRFDKDVLQNGMDPLSFIRYLRKLGTIVHVTTLFDMLPEYTDFNPELSYLGFEIDLSSEASKETLEEVFEFVQDMSQIHILAPRTHISHYAEMIDLLPELDMRIGEILVASGALTKKELDDALNYQSIISTEKSNDLKQPIGEVLIEKNVVHKEVLDIALDKQNKINKSSVHNVLRVDAEKLDNLINLVGELVISGANTNMLARSSGDETLIESMSSMSRLVEEIRDNALNLRMVPIGETFNRFKRVVRDVSSELGKDIKLNIDGADTELDKTVVEKIGDPLMHLVRNSMDHGIETGEERQAAGKPLQGNLKLNAYHDSGNIVIEVSDDGRGLSKEKILAKAHDKGLITEGHSLTDNEIYRLIFEAGFSTAEQVTNLSGRGVGMDVVRRNIEALRGTVDIASKENEGTTVSIRLPLTLAIIDGFLVRVGESSYVIPLDMVNECIELEDKEHNDGRTQGYINLRDEVLPFIRLRDCFGESGSETDVESIVVVKYAGYKAGFVVDELLGELQTVIKPMGKILQNVKGVSGATILGSGDVAVILDVPNLVQRAVASGSAIMAVHANAVKQNNTVQH